MKLVLGLQLPVDYQWLAVVEQLIVVVAVVPLIVLVVLIELLLPVIAE